MLQSSSMACTRLSRPAHQTCSFSATRRPAASSAAAKVVRVIRRSPHDGQVAAPRLVVKAFNSTTSSTAPTAAEQTVCSLRPSYIERKQAVASILECLDATTAAAKQALSQTQQAVPELTLSVDAYSAVVKKAACKELKVSPSIMGVADLERAKERLATRSLMSLSLDNNEPHLDWTSLHPAFGVPLLRAFINRGSADSFGLPVFLSQPQQPFELGLDAYHQMLTQRPQFVGRILEHYWDDTVTAEPHPFPVMSVSELAQEVLSVRVLESVLSGFDAGRSLLTAVKGLGLRGFGAGGEASAGVVGARAASWWDLCVSNSAAALGVFYLSPPNTPLSVFVRQAASVVTSSSSNSGKPIWPVFNFKRVCNALSEAACGDGSGGRVWGRGQLTAVGDGFMGGVGGWGGPLPRCESRERDEGAPVLGAEPAEGRRKGLLGAVARRLFGWRRRCA